MSTKDRLSDSQTPKVPTDKTHRFTVLVAEWNTEITHALRDGCVQTLLNQGVTEDRIRVVSVPGSFELSSAAAYFASRPDCDAVICLGCVIQGETRHFDFICQAVADGITRVGIQYLKPAIFGVLTTNNQQQAKERAGGKLGNKGSEAAEAALQMLAIMKS
ncbi:MAG: 6,7-dimethyl-8-ribityllumazine synthase [Bacteroidales bacterium]|nr:6,7-dimethyl-8-ribityllumazine synthase [Bacteroidales bacterium]